MLKPLNKYHTKANERLGLIKHQKNYNFWAACVTCGGRMIQSCEIWVDFLNAASPNLLPQSVSKHEVIWVDDLEHTF